MMRLVVVLVGGLSTAAAFGASPDPKDLEIPPAELSRARTLVGQLGSDDYREREDAHAELLKMGRKALQALRDAAASDPDPEVRFRSSRLLPRADADDLKARLDTFLADSECKYEHNLPGLQAFRKTIGADEKARALYVDVVRSPHNLELLQAVERTRRDGGRAIADRRAALYTQIQHRNINGAVIPPKAITLPEIACLLFAESLIPGSDIPRSEIWGNITGVTFIHQQTVQTAIPSSSRDPHAAAFRRLLGCWMDSRDDLQDLNQLAYLAGQQLAGLPESERLLRRIATTEGVQGYAKAQAMRFLAQTGKWDELPFLMKLMGDETLVTQVNCGVGRGVGQPQLHPCLVRDVALAYLIQISGQKMKDYGFSFAPGYIEAQQQFNYGNFAFASEEVRRAATVKFAFWLFNRGLRDPGAKDPEPKNDPAQEPPRQGRRLIRPPPPPVALPAVPPPAKK